MVMVPSFKQKEIIKTKGVPNLFIIYFYLTFFIFIFIKRSKKKDKLYKKLSGN